MFAVLSEMVVDTAPPSALLTKDGVIHKLQGHAKNKIILLTFEICFEANHH
jgi:hypothetical protein